MRLKADRKFPSHRTEDRYTVSIYHTNDSQTSLHLAEGRHKDTPPSSGVETDRHPPPSGMKTDRQPPPSGMKTDKFPHSGVKTDRQVSTQRSEDRQASTQQSEDRRVSTQKSEDRRVSTQQSEDRQVSTQQSEDRQVSTQQSEDRQVSTQKREDRHVSTQQNEDRHVSTQQSEAGSPVAKGQSTVGEELFLHTSGSGPGPGSLASLPAVMALAQLLPPAFIELPPLHTTSRTASNSHSPVYAQFQPRRHLRITV